MLLLLFRYMYNAFLCSVYTKSSQMIGISFHVGSDCRDTAAYAKPIQAARKLFDYAKTVGFEFNLLDIGGGFQGDKGTTIKEVRHSISYTLRPDVTICFLAGCSGNKRKSRHPFSIA